MKNSIGYYKALAGLLCFGLLVTCSAFGQTEAFSVKSSTTGANFFYIDTNGGVAIDTSTTLGSLTVSGNNGLIAFGKMESGTPLNLGGGTRFMWYPQKSALRAGFAVGSNWDDAQIGYYSTAMGYGVTAKGMSSVAIGDNAFADTTNATAIGSTVAAENTGATAIGNGSVASGWHSTALGSGAFASGSSSMALGGFAVDATGDYSFALGTEASTNNHVGSFVYGDYSNTQSLLNASADNQFMVRAAGGYVFYTNPAMSVGAQLQPGQNQWSTISDSTKKCDFLPVNGQGILRRMDKFDLRTWSYRGQDPRKYRHYGPMAQEFFSAFGHDKYGTIGNDTTINTADFEGVLLVAVQALERRTKRLHDYAETIARLRSKTIRLKNRMQDQQREIDSQNLVIAQFKNEVSELKRSVSVILKRRENARNNLATLDVSGK